MLRPGVSCFLRNEREWGMTLTKHFILGYSADFEDMIELFYNEMIL